MSSEAYKISSKQCGTVVCYIGFYLEIGQNWSPWSEFCCLLYRFHCVQTAEMKLQKHDDNSMGFLSAEFLYSTLLCQMCFKYNLLQVAQVPASKTTHNLIQAHTSTAIHNTHEDRGAHSRSHSHHCLWKRILKVCFTELGRGGRIFSFSPSSSRCVFERERERVEQCRPGHFIITVRKHSMKLSQGSKEGCLHNIPPLLLSKLALFYILQLKALFSFTFQSLSFCLGPIWILRCLDFFVLSCSYIYLLVLKCTLYESKHPKGSSSRCWDSLQEQYHSV